ncbi:MAG: hypothetical protein Q4F11_02155 [Eubacteriales bacterium]|nr:hypothetical protein [Eubacteriales bacterium]
MQKPKRIRAVLGRWQIKMPLLLCEHGGWYDMAEGWNDFLITVDKYAVFRV